MIIWKKNKKFRTLKQFIEDFTLLIKQCYHFVWSVEKMQKVKTQKSEKGRIKFLSKYTVCTVKSQDLSKRKKLVAY